MAKLVLKEYQKEICDWICKSERSAIFASMGSGKTVSTLMALEKLNLVEQIYPVLVLAPLRVAKTTWPEEVKKWDVLQHLDVTVITGDVANRNKAVLIDSQIYTTNYENLPWLVAHFGKDWPFKTVVCDESTRLKGFRLRQGSARAKALAKVAHTKVERIVLLTGTPASNGIKDLWGQLWFVDEGKRLGKSYTKFTDTWFTTDYSGFNLLIKQGAQEEIQELIKDICLTIKVEDWLPIGTPIANKILLTMPAKANSLYKKMEKEMFTQLETGDIEVFSRGAADMKCAQIANGAVYLEDKKWEGVHDEKLDALESVIEEANGVPILVAYRFNSDLARLQKAFPQGRALDANPNTIKEWNAREIPILFIHPKAGGIGLNLADGSNILVFFSIDWNLEDHAQTIERIGCMRQMQAGLGRPVFLHYLLMKDTIDETIMERLETKKTVQDVLLDAMKRHRSKI